MPDHDQPELAFYTRPGAMTSAGRHGPALAALPPDLAGLATIGQGLLVHEHLGHLYGITIGEQDRASVHVRPVEQLLDRILAGDDRPLDVPREAAGRLPGNCRHFTVLMVALLRAHGPARARCGFGGYFGTGTFEDHWVCEYWNAGQRRWQLIDAQLDGRQREHFPIDFDVTDVPRDRFLTAGQAWELCRSGAADPDRFGLSFINEAGYWWIGGNLMRDAAALRNIELLPWDGWGAMPAPGPVDDELAVLFDRLAAATRDPDAAAAELRRLLETDDRLRVPPTVHNTILRRDEAIWPAGQPTASGSG